MMDDRSFCNKFDGLWKVMFEMKVGVLVYGEQLFFEIDRRRKEKSRESIGPRYLNDCSFRGHT